MTSLTIYDNTFLRQFEVEVDQGLAKIEYALQDRKIFLTKLVVPNSDSNPDFEETFINWFSKNDLYNLKMITNSLLFTLIPLHNNDKCLKYYNLIKI